MDETEFNEAVEDVVNIAAVSYSKTAWRDEEDFEALKRILRREIKLAFGHLLVTK